MKLSRLVISMAALSLLMVVDFGLPGQTARAAQAAQTSQIAKHNAMRHSGLHTKKSSKKPKRGLASVKKKSKHKSKKTSRRLETYPAIVES